MRLYIFEPTLFPAGYQTGAYLNLDQPVVNSDENSPVYAIADGSVTFAGEGGVYQGVVIIRHEFARVLPLDGTEQVSRVLLCYGGLALPLLVSPGDYVQRGQQIGAITHYTIPYYNRQDYDGLAWLTFDISYTDLLSYNPLQEQGPDQQTLITRSGFAPRTNCSRSSALTSSLIRASSY